MHVHPFQVLLLWEISIDVDWGNGLPCEGLDDLAWKFTFPAAKAVFLSTIYMYQDLELWHCKL